MLLWAVIAEAAPGLRLCRFGEGKHRSTCPRPIEPIILTFDEAGGLATTRPNLTRRSDIKLACFT